MTYLFQIQGLCVSSDSRRRHLVYPRGSRKVAQVEGSGAWCKSTSEGRRNDANCLEKEAKARYFGRNGMGFFFT
jgi:hypothetical protein